VTPLAAQNAHLYHSVDDTWANMAPEAFWARYDAEVGDVEELEGSVIETLALDFPLYGPGVVRVLKNGLSILETSKGLSLFETESRYKYRTHVQAWADFARGHWSRKVPKVPGRYFVKDLSEGILAIREIKKIGDRLVDVTGGMVRPGVVTEYQGFWWLPRLPGLPDSRE
jgi:hypothetical protein